MRRLTIPILALVGVILVIFMVFWGMRKVTPAQPASQPAKIPFSHFVSGAGIIESASEDVWIATPVSGVIEEVCVKVGDRVEAGELLFTIDDAVEQSRLLLRRAALGVAKAQLIEAESEVADRARQYELASQVSDKRAISQEEIDKRWHALQHAEAKRETARAEMARVRAEIEATETEIREHSVCSPIHGQVLQVNIHSGEYAMAGISNEPLILLGDTSVLHVRVDIDENDAWRFNPKGKAVAVLRGNAEVQFPLHFVRVEPYVLPKRSLTGETTERVDTRVLQVIYRFDPDHLPVYVGQQVDVSIATKAEGDEDFSQMRASSSSR